MLTILVIIFMKFLDNKRPYFVINETKNQAIYIKMCTVLSF